MSSVFPTGLDSFPDPQPGDPGSSPSHSQLHQRTNDAVEKLEAKVGVDAEWLVRFVDPANGDDTRVGYDPGRAKRSMGAAYADLSANGGAIILMPGSHDVGAGLTLAKTKPVRLVSMLGLASRPLGTAANPGDARVYSSAGTPPGALITINDAGANNGHGFTFKGLFFDLGTGVSYAIDAVNVGSSLIEDCMSIGAATGSQTIAQYLLRTGIDAKTGADASWWRLVVNSTYHTSLHKAGAAAQGTGACNQHQWAHNRLNGGALIDPFINVWGGTRCGSWGNNLEGPVAVAIQIEQTRQSSFIGDGGEIVSTMIRAIGTTNNNGNLFAPLGITTGQAGKKLVDDDNPKRNVNLSAPIGWQVGYDERQPFKVITAAGVTQINQWERYIQCDATLGNQSPTLPTASSARGEEHRIRRIDATANTVTILSAGGTIDGAASVTLPAGTSMLFVPDGTNWKRID